MAKLKTKVINITIKERGDFDSKELKIDSGKVVKCALFTDAAPGEIVNIKIEDANNNEELHPFVTHKEYQPTNGNHFDSRKDIHFDGNRRINVVAKAIKPLAKEFTCQMMFYIDQEQQ
ncbi:MULTISPECIES: TRAM domain-containing protein [unclassified Tenacibaculum]|uniref:TRAM domain-containing protein n=1 Tax=unclassified Tenacibaculum TaxID=2635139 RepID=UPI001F351635|nr:MULTISPECIES: TRAM domain-containing protein [unclassified Tenacibaculum]MCF2875424.1 TRAM domain-containing protein [Tenacibaculum sp. Cn5-1]MCF2935500.1 TRAM domain-containing protein [Tenacibaculum sp. Cn5-34]MCG7512060.1 TRAM domain-containing protein [Tenacibaculum sp. Cn5-46]